MTNLKVSLIVTTYNWPEALRIVLESILRQTVLPYEIIIADDGSDEDTAKIIRDILLKCKIKWQHVWHPDEGVRQSRIKNLAVSRSSGEYLVFIDHDVPLHRDFLRDHILFAEEGTFLQGKRVLLSKELTHKILNGGYRAVSNLSFYTKGLKNRKNCLRYLPLARMFSRKRSFQTSLRGCNLSLFRKDFLEVDGFDEIYDRSWGREDSDICYRLFHKGVKVKNLWFCALQYHLWHPVVRDWERERLDRQLREVLWEGRILALKGLSRLNQDY